jgi:hypothetical protein
VDVKWDTLNCGVCGRACGPSQACVNGQCGCSSFGYSVCGDVCANLDFDVAHCGTCGKACKPGEVCRSGSCACESGVYCADRCMPLYDAQNCGACGRACGQAQYCSFGGTCECSGATACGAQCVDTQFDANNCGTCGKKCGANQRCWYGQCTCSEGFSECGSTCANLGTDRRNCGQCGNVCDPTELCTFGSCACPQANQAYCAAAGQCIDVMEDEANCGDCGRRCPTGTQCRAGQCACNDATQTLCDTTCKNLQTDRTACGGCGRVCDGKAVCTSGECKCPAPLLGTLTRITTSSGVQQARAAWNGTRVGVAYLNAGQVVFTLLNANGSRALTADLPLTNYASGQSAGELSDLIWNGSEFAVLWRINDGGWPSVAFQRLNADGSLKGAAVVLAKTGPFSSARVAWTAARGYAIAGFQYSHFDTSVGLQVLGTDGSQPGTVSNFVLTPGLAASSPLEFAGSSSGEWGVLLGSPVRLLRINSDGSRTQPIGSLSSTGRIGGIVHDGTDWITTWSDDRSTSSSSFTLITVNRGMSSVNADIVAGTQFSSQFGVPLMALDPRGALTMSWPKKLTAQDSDYTIAAQRFMYPSLGPSLGLLLSPELEVLSTSNVPEQYTNEWGELVTTGAARAMQVWIDNRYGNKEVMARSIDFRDCP